MAPRTDSSASRFWGGIGAVCETWASSATSGFKRSEGGLARGGKRRLARPGQVVEIYPYAGIRNTCSFQLSPAGRTSSPGTLTAGEHELSAKSGIFGPFSTVGGSDCGSIVTL